MNIARCIYNVDLKTNNNEIISIPSDFFDHFYIANLNDNGDEIDYDIEKNSLKANFFMIKVFNEDNDDVINRILKKKDIISINLYFTNGERQKFNIPKKRVTANGTTENIYESIYELDNDIGIVVTDKNIKYKKELFV